MTAEEIADWIIDSDGGLKLDVIAAIHADREESAKALDTIAASSPPGSEPLGFHAGVRHACAGGAAVIRGRK